jgi:hypothetical protein
MPLTLTETAGGVDSNSYASAAAALAVAAYRPAGAAFIALTADQQVQALATVTQDIDSIAYPAPGQYGGFIGERATTTQALEWPRTGTAYAGLPASLVAATIEYAILMAPQVAAGTYTLEAVSGLGNIKREKVDTIEVEYFAGAAPVADALARFPRIVQDLLRSLVMAPVANTWGSGTAARGS